MITEVDSGIMRELTRARDRLLRAEGAVDQAGKAVEAARAAHRRAAEEMAAERALVGRLERELREGVDPPPILAALERAADGEGGIAKLSEKRDSGFSASPPRGAVPGGEDDDEGSPGLDALLTEFVARAEARKAANGRPAPAADWRAVSVANLLLWAGGMAASGRAAISGHLADLCEIETVDDLAVYLSDGNGLDGLGLDPAEADALRRALVAFRAAQGWTGSTTWPDGIPAAWLEPDVGETPAPPPDPKPSRRRSDDGRREGETVRAYRERRRAERRAAGLPIRASGAEAMAEFDAAREEIARRERAAANRGEVASAVG